MVPHVLLLTVQYSIHDLKQEKKYLVYTEAFETPDVKRAFIGLALE